MSREDQDTYVAQAGLVAQRLGADPVPQTRAEAVALIERFKPDLRADDRARAVAGLVLAQPSPSLAAAPAQHLLMQAAVDLMPEWAKAMHDRRVSPLSLPLVRGGSLTIAKTLHWAFTGLRAAPNKAY
jgi:uncharacterized protein (DUF2236 family)